MSDELQSARSLAAGGSFPADRTRYPRTTPIRHGDWIAVAWRRLLVAIVLLEISLQVDTFLFHDLNEAEFGAISGFNISLTTICLFFLYLQWLPGLVVSSAPVQTSKALLASLVIVACSILWAVDKNRTLYELFLIAQGFMIFFYFLNNLKTRSDVLFTMTFLAIGLIIQSTAMIAVRLLGHEISFGPIDFDFSEIDRRVTGSFGSPNVASSYIAILLTPCLSLLFFPVSNRLRLLATAAIASGGMALVLTMSRGGWLAATVSLAIFLTIACRKGWLSGLKIVLLLCCLALFVVGSLPLLADRLLGDDAGSAASRMPLNEITLSMVADNFLGVGANNWDLAARHYWNQKQYREEWFYFVHNRYLLTLAEVGWVGLAALVAFLYSIQVSAWRALRRIDDPMSPLLLGFTSAIIGQMVHMWFDIFNSRSQIQMFCLVAALVFVIAGMITNSGDRESLSNRNSTAPALS